MEQLEFYQKLSENLNQITQNISEIDKSVYCTSALELIQEYIRNEKDFENKCKALTHCLLYFSGARPLFGTSDGAADSLGQLIFVECARLVLGIEFQQCDDESDVKKSFKDAISETYGNLQSFLIGQVFVVLQWLIVNGWNHPTLSAMLTGGEIEEEAALTYLRSGEFPEILKLRIEILIEQQCEDLALNLCSWCVRSPVFEEDVFVRKTHLLLLYKQSHDSFHSSCLKVSCCVLVKVLNELELEPESRDALLVICQTALLHNWLHPEEADMCCAEPMLRCSLRLEREQHDETQGFLNSVNKILQLSVNNDQRRLLLKVMVHLFGDEYLQFCSEVALVTLKKDRFGMDASKIKRDEAECDRATAGLTETCSIIAKLFSRHQQMCTAALMTVLYLDPDNDTFMELKNKLRQVTSIPPQRPEAPDDVAPDVYNEMYCVVDMLRPAGFHPSKGWAELKQTLVLHMLENGFVYDRNTNAFIKRQINKVSPSTSAQDTVKTSPNQSQAISTVKPEQTSDVDSKANEDKKLDDAMKHFESEMKHILTKHPGADEGGGKSGSDVITESPLVRASTSDTDKKEDKKSPGVRRRLTPGSKSGEDENLPELSLDDLEAVLHEVNVDEITKDSSNGSKGSASTPEDQSEGISEQEPNGNCLRLHSPPRVRRVVSCALTSTKSEGACNLALLEDMVAGLPKDQRRHLRGGIRTLLQQLLRNLGVRMPESIMRGSMRVRLDKLMSSIDESEAYKPSVSRLQKLLVLDCVLQFADSERPVPNDDSFSLATRELRAVSAGGSKSPIATDESQHSLFFQKRNRTSFTEEAIEVLKEWFEQHRQRPFPTAEDKKMLSEKTGFSEKSLQIWFQNYRQKMKRQGTEFTPWGEVRGTKAEGTSPNTTPPKSSSIKISPVSQLNLSDASKDGILEAEIAKAAKPKSTPTPPKSNMRQFLIDHSPKKLSKGQDGWVSILPPALQKPAESSEEREIDKISTGDWRGFMLFTRAKRDEALQQYSATMITQVLVHWWRDLSDDQRATYSEEAQEEEKSSEENSTPKKEQDSASSSSKSSPTVEKQKSGDSENSGELNENSQSSENRDEKRDENTPRKKYNERTKWTTSATIILQHWFHQHEHHPFPDKKERELLCELTGETSKAVKIWFQNYRQKMKRVKSGAQSPRSPRTPIDAAKHPLSGLVAKVELEKTNLSAIEISEASTSEPVEIKEEAKDTDSFAEKSNENIADVKIEPMDVEKTQDSTKENPVQEKLDESIAEKPAKNASQDLISETVNKPEASSTEKNYHSSVITEPSHPVTITADKPVPETPNVEQTEVPQSAVLVENIPKDEPTETQNEKTRSNSIKMKDVTESEAAVSATVTESDMPDEDDIEVTASQLHVKTEPAELPLQVSNPRRYKKLSKAQRKRMSDPNYVPRPLNPFMLYYQHKRISLSQEMPHHDTATLSSMVAKIWKQLDQAEKQPFYDKAQQLKEEHKRKYPNYKWIIRKNKDKTTPTAQSSTSTSYVESPDNSYQGATNFQTANQPSMQSSYQDYIQDSSSQIGFQTQYSGSMDSSTLGFSSNMPFENQESGMFMGAMDANQIPPLNASNPLPVVTASSLGESGPSSPKTFFEMQPAASKPPVKLEEKPTPNIVGPNPSSDMGSSSAMGSIGTMGSICAMGAAPTNISSSTPMVSNAMLELGSENGSGFVTSSELNTSLDDSEFDQTPHGTPSKTSSTPSTPSDGKKKRANYKEEHNSLLWSYTLAHLQCPYPSKSLMGALAKMTNSTAIQVQQWFENCRFRKLARVTMVDGEPCKIHNKLKVPFRVSGHFLKLKGVTDVEELKEKLNVRPWSEHEPKVASFLAEVEKEKAMEQNKKANIVHKSQQPLTLRPAEMNQPTNQPFSQSCSVAPAIAIPLYTQPSSVGTGNNKQTIAAPIEPLNISPATQQANLISTATHIEQRTTQMQQPGINDQQFQGSASQVDQVKPNVQQPIAIHNPQAMNNPVAQTPLQSQTHNPTQIQTQRIHQQPMPNPQIQQNTMVQNMQESHFTPFANQPQNSTPSQSTSHPIIIKPEIQFRNSPSVSNPQVLTQQSLNPMQNPQTIPPQQTNAAFSHQNSQASSMTSNSFDMHDGLQDCFIPSMWRDSDGQNEAMLTGSGMIESNQASFSHEFQHMNPMNPSQSFDQHGMMPIMNPNQQASYQQFGNHTVTNLDTFVPPPPSTPVPPQQQPPPQINTDGMTSWPPTAEMSSLLSPASSVSTERPESARADKHRLDTRKLQLKERENIIWCWILHNLDSPFPRKKDASALSILCKVQKKLLGKQVSRLRQNKLEEVEAIRYDEKGEAVKDTLYRVSQKTLSKYHCSTEEEMRAQFMPYKELLRHMQPYREMSDKQLTGLLDRLTTEGESGISPERPSRPFSQQAPSFQTSANSSKVPANPHSNAMLPTNQHNNALVPANQASNMGFTQHGNNMTMVQQGNMSYAGPMQGNMGTMQIQQPSSSFPVNTQNAINMPGFTPGNATTLVQQNQTSSNMSIIQPQQNMAILQPNNQTKGIITMPPQQQGMVVMQNQQNTVNLTTVQTQGLQQGAVLSQGTQQCVQMTMVTQHTAVNQQTLQPGNQIIFTSSQPLQGVVSQQINTSQQRQFLSLPVTPSNTTTQMAPVMQQNIVNTLNTQNNTATPLYMQSFQPHSSVQSTSQVYQPLNSLAGQVNSIPPTPINQVIQPVATFPSSTGNQLIAASHTYFPQGGSQVIAHSDNAFQGTSQQDNMTISQTTPSQMVQPNTTVHLQPNQGTLPANTSENMTDLDQKPVITSTGEGQTIEILDMNTQQKNYGINHSQSSTHSTQYGTQDENTNQNRNVEEDTMSVKYEGFMQQGCGSSQGDCDSSDATGGRENACFTDKQLNVIWAWVIQHLHHPYVTTNEATALANITGSDCNKVKKWFWRTRSKKVRPSGLYRHGQYPKPHSLSPALLKTWGCKDEQEAAQRFPWTDALAEQFAAQLSALGVKDGTKSRTKANSHQAVTRKQYVFWSWVLQNIHKPFLPSDKSEQGHVLSVLAKEAGCSEKQAQKWVSKTRCERLAYKSDNKGKKKYYVPEKILINFDVKDVQELREKVMPWPELEAKLNAEDKSDESSLSSDEEQAESGSESGFNDGSSNVSERTTDEDLPTNPTPDPGALPSHFSTDNDSNNEQQRPTMGSVERPQPRVRTRSSTAAEVKDERETEKSEKLNVAKEFVGGETYHADGEPGSSKSGYEEKVEADVKTSVSEHATNGIVTSVTNVNAIVGDMHATDNQTISSMDNTVDPLSNERQRRPSSDKTQKRRNSEPEVTKVKHNGIEVTFTECDDTDLDSDSADDDPDVQSDADIKPQIVPNETYSTQKTEATSGSERTNSGSAPDNNLAVTAENSSSLNSAIKKMSKEQTKENSAAVEKRSKASKNARRFDKSQQDIMWSWLIHNASNPYPSKKETTALALITESPYAQVLAWIRTTRVRWLDRTDDTIKSSQRRYVYKIAEGLPARLGAPDLETAIQKVAPWDELKRKMDFYLAMDQHLLSESIETLETQLEFQAAARAREDAIKQGTGPVTTPRSTPGGPMGNPAGRVSTGDEEFNDNLTDILSRLDGFTQQLPASAHDTSLSSLTPISEIDEVPGLHSAIQRQPSASASNPLRCKYCDKSYDSMAQRRRHEQFFCRNNTDQEDGADPTAPPASDGEADVTMTSSDNTCTLCDKKFVSRAYLNKHLSTMHEGEDWAEHSVEGAGLMDSDDDLLDDFENDADSDDSGDDDWRPRGLKHAAKSGNSRIGTISGSEDENKESGEWKIVFPAEIEDVDKIRFKRHLVTKDMRFDCLICDVSMKTDLSLNTHVANEHDFRISTYMFICPFKICKRKNKLYQHLRSLHIHMQNAHGSLAGMDKIKYCYHGKFIKEAKDKIQKPVEISLNINQPSHTNYARVQGGKKITPRKERDVATSVDEDNLSVSSLDLKLMSEKETENEQDKMKSEPEKEGDVSSASSSQAEVMTLHWKEKKLFDCPVCSTKDMPRRMDQLIHHVRKIHLIQEPIYVFSCPVETCKSKFYYLIRMRRHIRREHANLTCPDIVQYRTNPLFSAKMRNPRLLQFVTKDMKFACHVCHEQEYSGENALWKHMKEVHLLSMSTYMFHCPEMDCPRKHKLYSTIGALQYHMKFVHKKPFVRENISYVINPKIKKIVENGGKIPHLDESTVSNNTAKSKEMKLGAKPGREIESKKEDGEKSDDTENYNDEEENEDKTKIDALSEAEKLNDGTVRYVDDEMKHMCYICSAVFSKDIALIGHIKRRHGYSTSWVIYRCPVLDCKAQDREFIFLSSVKRHLLKDHNIRIAHEKIPYYINPKVLKSFQQTALEVKIVQEPIEAFEFISTPSKQAEADVPQHVCAECDEVFHNEAALARHNRYMHPVWMRKRGSAETPARRPVKKRKFDTKKPTPSRTMRTRKQVTEEESAKLAKRNTVIQKHREIGEKYKRLNMARLQLSPKSKTVEEKYMNLRRSIRHNAPNSPVKRNLRKRSLSSRDSSPKKIRRSLAASRLKKPKTCVRKTKASDNREAPRGRKRRMRVCSKDSDVSSVGSSVKVIMRGPLDDSSDEGGYIRAPSAIQTQAPSMSRDIKQEDKVTTLKTRDQKPEVKPSVTTVTVMRGPLDSDEDVIAPVKHKPLLSTLPGIQAVKSEQISTTESPRTAHLKSLMINPLDSDVELERASGVPKRPLPSFANIESPAITVKPRTAICSITKMRDSVLEKSPHRDKIKACFVSMNKCGNRSPVRVKLDGRQRYVETEQKKEQLCGELDKNTETKSPTGTIAEKDENKLEVALSIEKVENKITVVENSQVDVKKIDSDKETSICSLKETKTGNDEVKSTECAVKDVKIEESEAISTNIDGVTEASKTTEAEFNETSKANAENSSTNEASGPSDAGTEAKENIIRTLADTQSTSTNLDTSEISTTEATKSTVPIASTQASAISTSANTQSTVVVTAAEAITTGTQPDVICSYSGTQCSSARTNTQVHAISTRSSTRSSSDAVKSEVGMKNPTKEVKSSTEPTVKDTKATDEANSEINKQQSLKEDGATKNYPSTSGILTSILTSKPLRASTPKDNLITPIPRRASTPPASTTNTNSSPASTPPRRRSLPMRSARSRRHQVLLAAMDTSESDVESRDDSQDEDYRPSDGENETRRAKHTSQPKQHIVAPPKSGVTPWTFQPGVANKSGVLKPGVSSPIKHTWGRQVAQNKKYQFACASCHFVTGDVTLMRSHVMVRHGSKVTKQVKEIKPYWYTCSLCVTFKNDFEDKDSVINHMMSFHKLTRDQLDFNAIRVRPNPFYREEKLRQQLQMQDKLKQTQKEANPVAAKIPAKRTASVADNDAVIDLTDDDPKPEVTSQVASGQGQATKKRRLSFDASQSNTTQSTAIKRRYSTDNQSAVTISPRTQTRKSSTDSSSKNPNVNTPSSSVTVSKRRIQTAIVTKDASNKTTSVTMVTHEAPSNSENLVCLLCDARFQTQEQLNIHIRKGHTVEQKSAEPNSVTTRSSRRNANNTKNTIPPTSSTLKPSSARKRSILDDYCPFCELQLASLSGVFRHVKRKHPGHLQEAQELTNQERASRKQQGIRQYPQTLSSVVTRPRAVQQQRAHVLSHQHQSALAPIGERETRIHVSSSGTEITYASNPSDIESKPKLSDFVGKTSETKNVISLDSESDVINISADESSDASPSQPDGASQNNQSKAALDTSFELVCEEIL